MFDEWTHLQLRAIAQVTNWVTFNAGDVIIKEGEDLRNFIFIKSGEAMIYNQVTFKGILNFNRYSF